MIYAPVDKREFFMKKSIGFLFALLIVFFSVGAVQAQAPESIWLDAGTTAYKTGEIVIIRINSASSTPIQGFTFQLRYDPACLKPISASSPIAGMNGLQLPQTTGIVDASFASTAPQSAMGMLAEASFLSLGGCQTAVYLESAALAIRDASGFAAALPGVTLGERNIALVIDSAQGDAQAPVSVGTPLSLDPSETAVSKGTDWSVIIAVALLLIVVTAIVITVIFVIYKQKK